MQETESSLEPTKCHIILSIDSIVKNCESGPAKRGLFHMLSFWLRIIARIGPDGNLPSPESACYRAGRWRGCRSVKMKNVISHAIRSFKIIRMEIKFTFRYDKKTSYERWNGTEWKASGAKLLPAVVGRCDATRMLARPFLESNVFFFNNGFPLAMSELLNF